MGELIVFDKTGGAAQKLAWDVAKIHGGDAHDDVSGHNLCGVPVDKAAFPVEQFKIVDPLQSLDRSRKVLAEILLGCEEADADDAGASVVQNEKKRIQYAWEQLSVFRHNG